MRIGIICYPTHGGSGIVATELGKHLAERGHQVAFISYAAPLRLSRPPAGVSFHEVEVVEYPLLQNFPHTLALASKIVTVARMKNLQLLHVHYAIPFAPAALLVKQIASELDLKVVTTLHGTDVTEVGSHPAFLPVTKLALEQSDAVTTVSHFLKEEAYRQFQVEKEIEVIYNFVDLDRHEAHIPSCVPPADSPGQRTLMHISNFRAVKRVVDVIEIFSYVAEKVDARLIMVGDGPDTCHALQKALELGISDRVRFTGVTEEVASLLKTADLFLLPSQLEGFGLAALEAMASGVPVIASDVGGLREVVQHGETGFLESVGDTKAMAEDAITLLTDHALYERLCKGARKRASALFDYHDIIPQYEGLYERLLGKSTSDSGE
ncbi:MAG: N-acetyl-alpha-D-glucosaminyl L-malate synthase BshA [Anaerolineales bacterium]